MTSPDVSFAARNVSGWRRQFVKPTGFWGWLAGHLLAWKSRERSLWVLSLLNLKPNSRVLEIGFGPGVDIQRVSRQVQQGFVAGIDHSSVMVHQASRRNAEAIRAGQVELQQGSADSLLPYPDASFDWIFAINVAQFWQQPQQVLKELQRVLKPSGKVAIAIQPRGATVTEEVAHKTGQNLIKQIQAAGFQQVRMESKAMKPVSVVCVIGTKVTT